MSIEQVTLVGCDEPNCQATFIHPNKYGDSNVLNQMTGEKASVKNGWTIGGDDHNYCPEHSKPGYLESHAVHNTQAKG